MNDVEKLQFCGSVCMAARRLGIYGRIRDGAFQWFDPMAGKRWTCEPADNDIDRVVNACNSLVNYLQWTNPNSSQSTGSGLGSTTTGVSS